jgi:two-component system, sensor histidine kinase PdtaS
MAAFTPTHPDVATNLALAVIASSNAPLILLDENLIILTASATFCDAFDIEPVGIIGRALCDIGAGEWNVPQLQSLLEATAANRANIDAYEMDLRRAGQTVRSLVLNAHLLDYGAGESVRLVLAITDVTEARANAKAKENLVREKAVLMQELQHRVANSLQIIASVLMQSVRGVQSEEGKASLRDAHNRVMSVGVLQQQLAQSQIGQVELRPYFTTLCKSIGASMIHDASRLVLSVDVDESSVEAEMSVSLGLIVTELVINALKHAFPDNRSGHIIVSFNTAGDGWTLGVRDDGIGMNIGPDAPKPGLGTGIVDALSNQLHARVVQEDATPGTAILIVHESE